MIVNLNDGNRTIRSTVIGTLLPGFPGTSVPEWLIRELRDGLAGVCLFGSNIESAAQIRELTSAIRGANPAAVITLDEEGGDVTRLYYDAGSPHPGNAVLGRLDDLAATYASAAAIGHDLRRAGCNLDLAPSADINSNPNNPVIGVRSFGDDASLVANHSAAWVQGLQSTGVAACLKHFPGHGDTAQDSHLTLPTVDAPLDVLLERELAPFRAAIAAGAATIMTSHILVPALDAHNPATFSRAILQDLLREELGFTGVIVTDALDMHGASGSIGIPAAAVRALAAGSDLLCLGSDTSEDEYNRVVAQISAAVQTGELRIDRLEDAQRRTASLFDRLPRAVQSADKPSNPPAQPLADAATVAGTFQLNSRARKWLANSTQPFQLYQLSSPANMAVGHVPWGPASLDSTPDASTMVHTIQGPGQELASIPAGARVALVGRNLHLNEPGMELISELRQQDIDIMVIEMGWPSADSTVADACTFGASQLISTALVGLLMGGLPQGAA
ncbi:glycoside hydrolase family 3 N-terminal domain-containing protein [Arthrobacter sp.]|uniref:glycoside hydrolase family 3 N-terminal domain-containing protein n=1 Tax=Arthrobacter sp. TaxID=1667 RepID=UPI00289FD235|nr:glycoside hydrolase family 3 N-terminal domain-containing protein [Arthrobacter sp.]